MKLYLSLIFLALFNIITIKSQFINFIPYSNSKCSGESVGIGFSVKIGESNCGSSLTPFAQKTEEINWDFILTEDNVILVNQYDVSDYNCVGNTINQHKYVNGTCGPTPNYVNSGYNYANVTSQKQYSFVSASPYPEFLPHSQISYQYGSNCASTNILGAFSYSNDLVLTYQGDNVSYYCTNSVPYVKTCLEGQKCITQNVASKCSSRSQYIQNFCN